MVIQRAIWAVTCHCLISDKLTWRHQVPAPCMSPPHPLPKRLSNGPLSTSLATNELSTAKVPGLWSSLAQMRLFLFVWVQKNLQKRSSGPRTLGNLRKFRTILGQGHFDQPPNLETENPIRASILSWTVTGSRCCNSIVQKPRPLDPLGTLGESVSPKIKHPNMGLNGIELDSPHFQLLKPHNHLPHSCSWFCNCLNT